MRIDKPILIFGANGQLGSALCSLLENRAIACSRDDVDLSDRQALASYLEKHHTIHAIINASAYTAVDEAETEVDLAHAINATAPELIAKHCAKHSIPLIHFSTDYVFDGQKQGSYSPDDVANPINSYGKSKYEGEQAIAAANAPALIFRTSWVYDAYHANFFTTMLRLAKERETLSVVNDQIGAPTYAANLALASLEALENALKKESFPSGIYHLCHQGKTSWFDFAKHIFSLARKQNIALTLQSTTPIPTKEYNTPANRPLNSQLDCSRTEAVLGVSLPHWKEGLNHAMDAYVQTHTHTS